MRGGYVLLEEGRQDENTILFVATGSEVHLCVAAAKVLAAEGRGVRVVSLPCVELFMRQEAAYRESVVPSTRPTSTGRPRPTPRRSRRSTFPTRPRSAERSSPLGKLRDVKWANGGIAP